MLAEWDRLLPNFMAWSKIRLNNNKPIMMNQATGDSGTKNSINDVGMNSINDDGVNLWSGLPEDIMDRIFSCLPLTSILRLRCVCKRWNAVVQSKRFQTALAKVSSPRPWFILCTMGRASCCYDPTMNKWHIITRPSNNGTSIPSPCTSILAVSGSLLCLGNQVSECKVLSICNPITKCQRNLPRMLQVSLIHKVTMISCPSKNNNLYKIMVSGESGLPAMSRSNPYTYELLTEVYDSSDNSWKMCGKPLPEAKFGTDPGVWCNDHLYYCITELPYGVVVFDLKTESWAELRIQMPPSLSSPSLVECCGRLLMIGRLLIDQISPRPDQAASNIPRIIIWELDIPRKEWAEIVRLPTEICRDFLVPLEFYAPFVCSGLGNHIYITTHRNPHVLVHDLCKNTWQWLPSDPFFPRRRDFHLLGFALDPRLDQCP